MSAYEAMVIFKPSLKEEEQKTLVSGLENILKEGQATLEKTQLFGQRQLAYEIDKCQEGLYYLIDFSAQKEDVVAKLKQACNINENVLRALVIKKGKKNG